MLYRYETFPSLINETIKMMKTKKLLLIILIIFISISVIGISTVLGLNAYVKSVGGAILAKKFP